jgi:hypothetical protein
MTVFASPKTPSDQNIGRYSLVLTAKSSSGLLRCLFWRGRGHFHIGEPGDAMALKAAVQRRAGQARNRRPQSIQTVVERQKFASTKSHDHAFLLSGEHR